MTMFQETIQRYKRKLDEEDDRETNELLDQISTQLAKPRAIRQVVEPTICHVNASASGTIKFIPLSVVTGNDSLLTLAICRRGTDESPTEIVKLEVAISFTRTHVSFSSFFLICLTLHLPIRIWSNTCRPASTKAKKEGFSDAVAQAAMASVVFCQQHGFETYRSCVTNGETWVFLVFNADSGGVGGTVSISKEFAIGEDLSGLRLMYVSLLDWIDRAKQKEQLHLALARERKKQHHDTFLEVAKRLPIAPPPPIATFI
ncbi:hypothetical protein B0H34DRAFT_807435 [Crassisporium funariophilum]|nr:hypothetical protein B0H34DRAFT_807435 [Crassisporium funariophilum]